MPKPAPHVSHFSRCGSVALANRGYQKRGTLRTRLSAKKTVKVSGVTRTSLTRSSVMAAEVLIPFGEKKILLLENNSPNPIQFNITESMIFRQENRRQPVLTRGTSFIHVNVGRLRCLMTVEIKLETLLAQHRRHVRKLGCRPEIDKVHANLHSFKVKVGTESDPPGNYFGAMKSSASSHHFSSGEAGQSLWPTSGWTIIFFRTGKWS